MLITHTFLLKSWASKGIIVFIKYFAHIDKNHLTCNFHESKLTKSYNIPSINKIYLIQEQNCKDNGDLKNHFTKEPLYNVPHHLDNFPGNDGLLHQLAKGMFRKSR